MVIAPQFKLIVPNLEAQDITTAYYLAKKFKTYQKILQGCKLTFKKPLSLTSCKKPSTFATPLLSRGKMSINDFINCAPSNFWMRLVQN